MVFLEKPDEKNPVYGQGGEREGRFQRDLARWEEYSRAKDEMFIHTDTPDAPWMVVEAEDKRRARLNMIAHLLSSVPWTRVERPKISLPERPPPRGYRRPPRDRYTAVPDHAGALVRHGDAAAS